MHLVSCTNTHHDTDIVGRGHGASYDFFQTRPSPPPPSKPMPLYGLSPNLKMKPPPSTEKQ